MKRVRTVTGTGLALLILISASSTLAASSARYEVTDLLSPAGSHSSSAQYDVLDNIDPLGTTPIGPSDAVTTTTTTPPEDTTEATPTPEATTPATPLTTTGGGLAQALAPLADALQALLAPLAAAASELAQQPGVAESHTILTAAAALTTAALAAVPALTGVGLGAAGAGAATAAQATSLIANNWLFAWFRRRKYAGRVYDVATKQPIVGATVRLIVESVAGFSPGKLVSTTVTNEKGEYRLSARNGQYRLEVVAPAYRFPSEFAATGYRGERLTTDPAGNVLVDVPLDGRTPATVIRIIQVQQIGRVLSSLRLPILVVGSASALVFALGSGGWLNWLVLAVYGLVWALEYRGYHLSRRQITVRAGSTPVRLAVVSAFSAEGVLLATRVTDRDGKTNVFLPPGRYAVEATAVGYETLRDTVNHRIGGTIQARLRFPEQPPAHASWVAAAEIIRPA
ncbi:carboxypeptidase regulatory-like domain-containing protein [Candidatus Berkelbacteria bacterium]|nr:carboxypeptidase regulatory-like domain-containing protein [Candidatus Berkelbacteria bacterium]